MRWRSRKVVDRREEGVAERVRLAPRLEQADQRRQQLMLVKKAISMPKPAINPSSDKPL